MPQNCCVPECKKKTYVENGVKISFHTFPAERKLFMKWIVAIRRDIGKHFQVTTHTRVCSRHFKTSDYLPSLAGRKRTLKPTAGPSVLHWKKRSPVKRKAPTRRSPIKRKKATEKTTAKADLRTCEVFVERQKTPLLSSITENLENTTVDQPADDSQTIIRDIQIENERLRKEIHQVTTLKENFKLKVEELTHRISVLEARVFTIDRFESDKDVTFIQNFLIELCLKAFLNFWTLEKRAKT
ncbi:uncharacterized protein LOC122956581 [Acropora millepora]|uniref:uncharacterized protein LOC122956581 n=1 Tax=Acropora millepora TaxID=45264 RepID=UPI001CF1FD99|nr:uncharacterized protein LOC122956581 [Acropora millepora]